MKSEIATLRIGHWFVNGIARNPVWGLTVFVGLTLMLCVGLLHLGSDFSLNAYLADEDPLMVDFKRFENDFGNDDTIAIALHSPSGIFDRESMDLLAAFTTQLEKVVDVDRVTSLVNHTQVLTVQDELRVEPLLPDDVEWTPAFLEARLELALGDEIIPNYLLSPNGRTTLLFAHLRSAFDESIEVKVLVKRLRELAETMTRGDHQVYITGGPIITISFEEEAMKDFRVLLPIMFVLITLCLAWALKSISSIFLSLIVVVLSISATFGLAGWAKEP